VLQLVLHSGGALGLCGHQPAVLVSGMRCTYPACTCVPKEVAEDSKPVAAPDYRWQRPMATLLIYKYISNAHMQ